MESELYDRIWQLAFPYQDKRDDSGHAEVSMAYAKMLLELEGGDEDVVIPAIILHDVGWSQLPRDERMLIFGKDVKDEEKKRVQLWHERESVRVGGEILKQVGYPNDLSAEILEIVSQHDTRKGFISKNEGLTRDADKLWRFSQRGFGTGLRRRPEDRDKMLERLQKDLEKPDYMYSESGKRMAGEELKKREAGSE
jgi:hypothetical protein